VLRHRIVRTEIGPCVVQFVAACACLEHKDERVCDFQHLFVLQRNSMPLIRWLNYHVDRDSKKSKQQAYHPDRVKKSRLSSSQKILCVVSIILPPAAVAVHVGVDVHFWVDLVLTLLGFIPGVIYALCVIVTHRPVTYTTKKKESSNSYF